jgi:hypothetical protein
LAVIILAVIPDGGGLPFRIGPSRFPNPNRRLTIWNK